jgi:hypothetical protein
MNCVSEFVEIIESKNRKYDSLSKSYDELYDRFQWLLKNVVESEDGVFTFPDGEFYVCKERIVQKYREASDIGFGVKS